MSVIFVLFHAFGQVIDIELWYTKHITFVSSHNLKDGSIFQLCWKRFLSVPMKRWHVVSDWTVCLRSNFKDRSTSFSVMYTLVQYTLIIHPFSQVENDVLSASQRLIWSNFRCDGTRSVRTSEAVTLHFFLWSQPFASALEAEIEKEVLCIHQRRLAWYYSIHTILLNTQQ